MVMIRAGSLFSVKYGLRLKKDLNIEHNTTQHNQMAAL
jgi:hypothetical protein